MSDEWKCPHCGTVFEKLPAFRMMEDRWQSAETVSVGGPTNCPYCHQKLDFNVLMTGKYDVKKWWQFWKRRQTKKKRFELWLRAPSVADNRDTLSFLIAKIGREKDWPHESVVELIERIQSGKYKIVPDRERGGCRIVVE